jgi:hypothetical protein
LRITWARKIPCPPDAAKKASGSNSSSSPESCSSSRASRSAAFALERRSSALGAFAFVDLITSGPFDFAALVVALAVLAGFAFLAGTAFLALGAAAVFVFALAFVGLALAVFAVLAFLAVAAFFAVLGVVFELLGFFFTAICASYDKVSLGTPMSTPSLQKRYSYYDITQYVNQSMGQNEANFAWNGAQLQKLRCLRHKMTSEWLFEFDFFPAPRKVIWVCEPSLKSWGWLEGSRPDEGCFASAQNPLFLYLRSHFVGRRLGGMSSVPGTQETQWDFGEGYGWQIKLIGTDILQWSMIVPGKRLFTKELKLYPSSFFLGEFFLDQVSVPIKKKDVVTSRQVDKQVRLLENIRNDLHGAKEWLTKYSSLCYELESRPWLWHQSIEVNEDQVWMTKIIELQNSGLLPKTRDASHLKSALDKLFNERSRQERKQDKAAKRLREIEVKIDSGEDLPLKPVQRTKVSRVEKTHPGLKIEIMDGVYGYLGRNSRENEVLFKWVRDRDYWFHVRGYAGAHLWVLRSDLGLPKDGTLPKHLSERAAKIALWNSKLKNSRSGPVDITEKRHLKKLKGEAGKLKISKSEVLFVNLEEGFENTLKWD